MTLYRNFKKGFQKCCPKHYKTLDQYKVIIKYLISGGMAASVDLGLLYIFTDMLGLHYLTSASIAFMFAFFVSFFMQKFWTFRDDSKNKTFKQMFYYLLIGLVNLGLNALGMYLLVGSFGLMYLVAQIIIGATLAVNNFMLYSFFIFKKKRKEKKQDKQNNGLEE